MNKRIIVLLVVSFLCVGVTHRTERPLVHSAQAEDHITGATDVTNEKSAQQTNKGSIDEIIVLTEKRLVEKALNDSLAIKIARYNAHIATTGLLHILSMYDTSLSLDLTYSDDQQAQASSIVAGKSLEND